MSAASPPRNRHWLRGLRPLFYWLLLVLVLYGIRTHQRLLEQTRLDFIVTLQGQPIYSASTTLDGKPAASGQKISLGSHTFAVTHPKGETYSTNMFVWYGEHSLGTIDLIRTMGTLSVTADPPAPLLFIRGPEWSVMLTNSSGLTKSVPTDAYDVEARYEHWQKSDTTSVFANQTTPYSFAPHFGTLQLGCNQTDATFQLQAADGRLISNGSLPVMVAGLPAGDYKLTITHHGHQRPETLTVKADTTTTEQIDFNYGAAVFETVPAGASVMTGDGQDVGATPLTLGELLPGNSSFTLQRNGYQSVQVSLVVTANQTNFVSTNLVSENYLHAMNTARQHMAAADYDNASKSVSDALAARPADADATALQREAAGLGYLQHAKALGNAGDYIGGGKELALAFQSLPENGEIKELTATYKNHEPEQIERERLERLARPKKVFDDFSAKTKDAELFEMNELTTTKPAKEVYDDIVNALERMQPNFTVTVHLSPQPEIYAIQANQIDSGILGASGYRQCLIVCGQASDDETQIFFKVMEYKAKHNITMPGLLAFKDNEEFIPIHPSRIPDMTDKLKTQVQAGVSNLTARIQGVIGQSPVVSQ